MKIEVLLCENIGERCTGSTCFEAVEFIRKGIMGEKEIQGIVIIDNTPVKFKFSSMGMDGDIFTSNQIHRTIVKNFIPIYVHSQKGV